LGYIGSWDSAEIAAGSYGHKTITAIWTPEVYSISYENLQGGTNPNWDITTYTIESETITFAAPTRTGYIGSWDSAEIAAGSYGHKTITAVWTPEVYNISYENLQDGTNPNWDITTYTIESDTIAFAAPIRTGYIGSWDSAEIAAGSYGNKIINAIWTPIEYKITFDANGGEGTMAEQSAPYGTTAILNGNEYTRKGYDFKGWATTNDGIVVYSNGAEYDIIIASDVTLYAVWQESPETSDPFVIVAVASVVVGIVLGIVMLIRRKKIR
ncbi:MAG: InlB B-repeat-containing protein, partial [Clostridiales bacterium]|nr:InlB B-repeat-containing protein [Clostridiales bacterium]